MDNFEIYEEPEMEIVQVTDEDVITGSPLDDGEKD